MWLLVTFCGWQFNCIHMKYNSIVYTWNEMLWPTINKAIPLLWFWYVLWVMLENAKSHKYLWVTDNWQIFVVDNSFAYLHAMIFYFTPVSVKYNLSLFHPQMKPRFFTFNKFWYNNLLSICLYDVLKTEFSYYNVYNFNQKCVADNSKKCDISSRQPQKFDK